jgi:hypothetical protein
MGRSEGKCVHANPWDGSAAMRYLLTAITALALLPVGCTECHWTKTESSRSMFDAGTDGEIQNRPEVEEQECATRCLADPESCVLKSGWDDAGVRQYYVVCCDRICSYPL